jgi:hypothetical protein
MSWDVRAIGRARAVQVEIAKQFESGSKCGEPEEGVRQFARTVVLAAIEAQGESIVVKVTAFGSQSRDHATGKISNSLSIVVEPQ